MCIRDRERFANKVAANVKEHGFHVTCVGRGKSAAYCYTTGVHETFGIPELIISSLPSGLCSQFMNSYIERFSVGLPQLGVLVHKESEPFDFYLIPADTQVLKDHVLATMRYYDDKPFEYLQLIYPDTAMKFPHEEGYNYDQEILGDYRTINAV